MLAHPRSHEFWKCPARELPWGIFVKSKTFRKAVREFIQIFCFFLSVEYINKDFCTGPRSTILITRKFSSFTRFEFSLVISDLQNSRFQTFAWIIREFMCGRIKGVRARKIDVPNIFCTFYCFFCFFFQFEI